MSIRSIRILIVAILLAMCLATQAAEAEIVRLRLSEIFGMNDTCCEFTSCQPSPLGIVKTDIVKTVLIVSVSISFVLVIAAASFFRIVTWVTLRGCKFRPWIMAALFLVFSVSSYSVDASPVQYRMTGIIDVQFQVGPLPEGVVQDGPFSAILSFDTSAPDLLPDDPHRGVYRTSDSHTSSLSLTAGQTIFNSRSPLRVSIGNDIDFIPGQLPLDLFPSDDSLLFTIPFDANFDHPSTTQFNVNWRAPNRSAFDSDALPTMLSASDFDNPVIQVSTFQFDNRVHQFSFNAIIQSIQRIPEPNTLTLAGLWYASAMCLWRRQLQVHPL